MDLNPKELRKLADELESENENIVRKKGYLKCDLYNFDSDSLNGIQLSIPWGDFWLKTEEEKNELIDLFKNRIEKVLEKGTEFVCYIIDGEECWFDNVNYGVEEADKNWASKYLVDIKEV